MGGVHPTIGNLRLAASQAIEASNTTRGRRRGSVRRRPPRGDSSRAGSPVFRRSARGSCSRIEDECRRLLALTMFKPISSQTMPSLFIKVVKDFHVIRQETDGVNHDVFAPAVPQSLR